MDWRRLLEKNLDTHCVGWRSGKYPLYATRVTVKRWVDDADSLPLPNMLEPTLGIDDRTREALLRGEPITEGGNLLFSAKKTGKIYRAYMREYIQHTSPLRHNLEVLGDVNVDDLYHVDKVVHEYAEKFRKRRPLFLSIEGVGGIGKTSIASAIAQALCEVTPTVLVNGHYRYHVICCVRIEGYADVPHARSRFVLGSIAEFLEVAGQQQGESIQDLRERICKHLGRADQQCLIILDNVETIEDIADILPHLNVLKDVASIIITSREQLAPHMAYQNLQVYHVNQLNQRTAHQLIVRELAKVGKGAGIRQADTKKLYHLVGGNPQALLLVAGLLRDHVDYEAVLQALSSPLPHTASDSPEETARSQMEVIFKRIYDTIWARLGLHARALYAVLSMAMPISGLHEKDMHKTILNMAHQYKEGSYDDYRRALTQLRGYYIIHQSGSVRSLHYSIHPLTRSFIRAAYYSTRA